MDELRSNKVFAGFLFAGLLLMAGVQLSHILLPEQELAENAYIIEVPEDANLAAGVLQDLGPEPILGLLALADIAAGEKLSKKCTACHVFAADGAAKVGPALWSIVDKAKASSDGFSYSSELAALGGNWDYQSLNAFLAKPKAYISGTKMNFTGLKKPQDRANMIVWLRSQADSQAALPTAEEIAAESGN
jgi:cytochrome c